MRVAVTGASGHVGATLVRELVKKGWQVKALVHNDSLGIDGLPIEIINGDINDTKAMDQLAHGADVFFHLAAKISIHSKKEWNELERINVKGVQNVVRACKAQKNIRLVHFSSIHSFLHHPRNQPLDETRHTADNSPYAYDRSKALGAKIVRDAVKEGLNAVILNPTGILGPNDYRISQMGEVLIKMYKGKYPVLIKQGFNWVDVRDIANTAIRAIDAGRPGEQYLLTGHYCGMYDVATQVAQLKGTSGPVATVPFWVAAMGIPFSYVASKVTGQNQKLTGYSLGAVLGPHVVIGDKAKNELGHSPRPLQETVADTLNWYKAHNFIQ